RAAGRYCRQAAAAPRSGPRPGAAAAGVAPAARMAGTSGKPLSQKLGIKPGFRIFADSARKSYGDIVGELPDGANVLARATPPLDMVHLFATRAAGLAGELKILRAAIAPDGMIWVSWPKKTSGVATDLSDVVVRDIAVPLGLVDVKV